MCFSRYDDMHPCGFTTSRLRRCRHDCVAERFNDANVLVFPVRQLCMSADRITAAAGDVEAFTELIDELLNRWKCLIENFPLYTVDGKEAVGLSWHF
jgi:hypothetical protein